MKKISPFQLVTLLFVTRAFLSVTYGVSLSGINLYLSLLSVLVSTAISLIMVIPPLICAAKYPDRDIIQVAFSKSRTAGILLSLGYGGFFLFEICRSMGTFSYFLTNQFFDFLPVWVLIGVLAAAAIYGAGCRIEALARTSAIAVIVFFAMFFVIIFSVTGEMDIFNLQAATPAPKNTAAAFFRDVSSKIAGSDELVALSFILPYVKRKSTQATLGYFGLKLSVMEIMAVYSALILGEYASGISQPFYTISTYAKTSIIERYDSLYMGVWALGTTVKCAVMIFIAASCLKNIGIKRGISAAGIIPAVTAAVLAFFGMYDSVFFRAPNLWVVVFLASVIPLVLCFEISKNRGEA